jgi:hypothetical protein
MASRLDAKKIEREHFSSHKRPRGPPDKPLGLCPAGGTGPSAGFANLIFVTPGKNCYLDGGGTRDPGIPGKLSRSKETILKRLKEKMKEKRNFYCKRKENLIAYLMDKNKEEKHWKWKYKKWKSKEEEGKRSKDIEKDLVSGFKSSNVEKLQMNNLSNNGDPTETTINSDSIQFCDTNGTKKFSKILKKGARVSCSIFSDDQNPMKKPKQVKNQKRKKSM